MKKGLLCIWFLVLLALPAAAAGQVSVQVEGGYTSEYGVDIPFARSPRAQDYIFALYGGGTATGVPEVQARVRIMEDGEVSVHLPLRYDFAEPGTWTLAVTAQVQSGRGGLDRARTVEHTFELPPTCGCAAGTKGAFYAGEGTAASPFLVASPQQLQHINDSRHLESGQYFLQVSDLDCSVYDNWIAVGSDQPFRGVYDGGGRRIKNLTMTGSATYCGVFGQLGGATIQNLGVDASCSFNLEQGLIGGGIVAQSSRGDNQIRQCFSEADIRILDTQGNTVRLGGILGNSEGGELTLQNCYSSATLTVGDVQHIHLGGILGYRSGNDAALTGNYFDGILRPGSATCFAQGGILGYLTSSGPSKFAANYWSSASGAAHGVGTDVYGNVGVNTGCPPLSAQQMGTQAGYAGFDFERIWRWDGTKGRPVLRVFDQEETVD